MKDPQRWIDVRNEAYGQTGVCEYDVVLANTHPRWTLEVRYRTCMGPAEAPSYLPEQVATLAPGAQVAAYSVGYGPDPFPETGVEVLEVRRVGA